MKINTEEELLQYIINRGHCGGINCVGMDRGRKSAFLTLTFNSVPCPLRICPKNNLKRVILARKKLKEILEMKAKLKHLEELK
jgi:hypothetical protein